MSKLINHMLDASLLDNLTKVGVYKITHAAKPVVFYIGSASGTFNGKKCQKGFYRRFLEHLRALENNKHSSKYLQNVVNKYGISGIKFTIIEIVNSDDRAVILEREQHYLDTLKPKYNSSTTARCPTVPYTAKRKKELSKKMKGVAFPQKVYDEIKTPVYKFNMLGLLICKYSSIKDATDDTGIDRASISKAANNIRPSAGGYLWSTTNECVIPVIKYVCQYNLKGLYIKSFKTIAEALRELDIKSHTSIRACLNNKQNQAYGFKWNYANPKEARELGFLK
jgi:group I intron endonuclease